MYTHRVVFFLAYGYWPKEVDHKDRNRRNNAPSNLREGDRKVNMQNRNVKGWDLHKPSGKWRARISVDGKVKSLGYFFTEEEAREAYLAAKVKYHEYYTEVL
ncbi:putative HNH endonuclease [Salmonella phage Kenya-K30]|nr:putative HNH endonuclease [Salmonella phage Kenya-K30]